jgi:sugar lactone lactonase YvrE
MRRKFNVPAAIFATLAGITLLFQNCGKVGFNYDYGNAYTQSGAGMIVNNGNPYTSQRIVAVQFTGQTQIFTQMRLSTNQDMDTVPVPWQSFSASTAFDLSTSWAPDGTKDGPLTIYAQIRKDDQSPNLPLAGSLALDTTPPSVAGLGILVNGIQGQDYTGQNVLLNFNASDVPAPSGYESGLSANGFRVGWTLTADCGDGVNWLGSAGPVRSQVPLQWPVPSTLDTFYVCAIVQDNAGNTSTFLSQPLTSVWRVFAGDNNPGDGETYNGPNVRFKLPGVMALDNEGNIYSADNQFFVIRQINKQNQIITTIAGNGRPAPPVNGPALQAAIGLVRSMNFDSQDNFYISSNSGVYLLAPDDSGVLQLSNLAMTCPSPSGVAVVASHFNGNKEYLLIASACNYNIDSPSTFAYIYDVPTSVLLEADAPLQQTDLVKYILAGNGSIPAAPPAFNIPLSQSMVVNGTGDQYSTGYPSAITVGPQGEFYVSTQGEPNGEPNGNYSVRRYTFQKNAPVLQELLSTNGGGSSQMAYGPAENGGSPFLLLALLGGLKELSLAPPAEGQLYTLTVPAYINTQQDVRGVLTVPGGGLGDLPEFYIAVSTLGQIYHLKNDVQTLIEIIGRGIYNMNEPVATQAQIGQPEGIVQDTTNGDTYFFDSQNDVVRRISSAGTNPINLVSGTPGYTASQDNSGLPLVPAPGASPNTGAIYNGLSAFTANGSYPLAGTFSASSRLLYLSEGRVGEVHQLDLTNNVVHTIAGMYTGKARQTVDVWDGQALALANINSGLALLDMRFCPYDTSKCASPPGTSYYYTGFISELNLPTPKQDSEVAVGGLLNTANQPNVPISKSGTAASQVLFQNATAMQVDSLNNLFVAGGAFYMFPISQSGSLGPVVNIPVDGSSRLSPANFEMYPDNNGQDRVVIYQSGPNLCTFRIPNIASVTPTNVPTGIVSQQLLLPGTFLKTVKAMAPTNDGNLLISDASNGRILEYFIHNESGQLVLQTVCSLNGTQSCPCSNQ